MSTRNIKSTCSLDLESVRLLVALARHWKVSKSEALRRALRIAARVAGPGKTPTGSLDRLQASLRERKVNLTRWEQEVVHERHATVWPQFSSRGFAWTPPFWWGDRLHSPGFQRGL